MRPIYYISSLFLLLAFTPVAQSQTSVRNQREPDRTQQNQNRNQQNQGQSAVQPPRTAPTATQQAPTRPPQQQPPQQQPAQTQTSDRRIRQQQNASDNNKSSNLTERARIKNEENSKAPSHIVWLREIYRVINLDSANNAALKFPVQPIGDRVNLFTLLFNLMTEGKIATYNYLADKEPDFSEKEKVNFENVLKNNQIPYTIQGSGNNAKFIVDEIDIPSQDVTEYLIKEGWYFDEATGAFNSKITLICPTIVRFDYNDNTTHKTNFCWIPYENIRPYLSRAMIMTSDYNNALTYTMDDYFMKKMYSGDIIKTVNMKDETLIQQVGDEPEALKHAQDSIERQLKAFEKQLWVQEDTTAVATTKKSQQKTSSGKNEKPKKEEKPKESKAEKSPAAPTKSVRRTR
ncbi:MAG: gliding motility protein GldN [Candidatus Symbiothrix sp.]|nr:gliding motility protein GldN [Candidatus Symbiothrix sp.]